MEGCSIACQQFWISNSVGCVCVYLHISVLFIGARCLYLLSLSQISAEMKPNPAERKKKFFTVCDCNLLSHRCWSQLEESFGKVEIVFAFQALGGTRSDARIRWGLKWVVVLTAAVHENNCLYLLWRWHTGLRATMMWFCSVPAIQFSCMSYCWGRYFYLTVRTSFNVPINSYSKSRQPIRTWRCHGIGVRVIIGAQDRLRQHRQKLELLKFNSIWMLKSGKIVTSFCQQRETKTATLLRLHVTNIAVEKTTRSTVKSVQQALMFTETMIYEAFSAR